MKYKILYVNLFPHIGGAETSLLYLIQKLDQARFEIYVILPQPGLFSERLKKTHAKIIFLDLPGYLIRMLFIPGANPKAIWKFYKLCKKIKPDLIHLNHITQAIYAGVVGSLINIPVVSTSWMNADSIYFYQDLATQISINKILPIHPQLKKRLLRKKIIAPKKIEVVFPGVDTKIFHPTNHKQQAKKELGLKKRNLTITIASRFDPTKDHLTFLRAMKIVEKQITNFTIIIAQDSKINLEDSSSPNQTKKQIDEFLDQNPQLKKKTIFIGYQKNMVPIYHATDILVSSSIYESLGFILIEGALCGLPIVTTNYDAQHYVVKENKTGFLVPIYNDKLMAKKIVILAKNAKMRTKFGKKARTRAVKYFSIERYVKQIEKIYGTLIR